MSGQHELRRSRESLPSPETGGPDRAAARRGTDPASAALAIARLRIANFRSYAAAEIAVSGRPVVLAGPNGAGKTNLLEAISLLAPGRGLRGASLADLVRKQPAADARWAIAATVRRGSEEYDVGSRLGASAGSAARQVFLNGAPAQSSADLGDLIQMAWLTPAMDRLFIEGASGRRRFLDRLTLGYAPAHARHSLDYERAMRERARLLKHGPRDPAWLGALERQMAGHGTAISAARWAAAARLNDALAARRISGAFPSAQLALEGAAAAPGEGEAAEAVFRENLERSRVRDAESGRTNFGPHLSDLMVRHTEKRMDARDCSTGEQKALLISIVLAHARELSHIREGLAPILLLDEIVAHLDAVRRAALFEEILALGAQAWLTGTERALFAPLAGHTDIFEVADSRLARALP